MRLARGHHEHPPRSSRPGLALNRRRHRQMRTYQRSECRFGEPAGLLQRVRLCVRLCALRWPAARLLRLTGLRGHERDRAFPGDALFRAAARDPRCDTAGIRQSQFRQLGLRFFFRLVVTERFRLVRRRRLLRAFESSQWRRDFGAGFRRRPRPDTTLIQADLGEEPCSPAAALAASVWLPAAS